MSTALGWLIGRAYVGWLRFGDWAWRNTIGRIVAAGIAHYQAERTAAYLAALGAAERQRVVRGMQRRRTQRDF